MGTIAIAGVQADNLPLFEDALRQLARDLGDPYRADRATLAAAVCGPAASCLALLASDDTQPVGAVLAAPVFSTIRGGAGLLVSDLWVAQRLRGQGLARRLLAAILRAGQHRNAGHFLKLAVYDDNPQALAAYGRLGFGAQGHETNMILAGPALGQLKEPI